MVVDFSIIGGKLQIKKKVFVREILKPDTIMKKLLNYNLEDSGKVRFLKIDKSRTDTVIIDFNFADNVSVGEDYQNLLKDLKREYKGDVRGVVTLSFDYYGLHIVKLDLNGGDEEVKLIV